MVRFRKSVTIEADPGTVFSLVTDVAHKASLNPNAEIIHVEQETDGRVGEQTVFHYTLRQGGQVIDYRTRCVAFESDRMMETVSLTEPSFGVRVTVQPHPEGTCLTQEEWFVLRPPPRPPRVPRKGPMGLLMNLAIGVFGDPEQNATPAEEAQMAAQLETRLGNWLQAIKRHLEDNQR